MTIAKSFAWVAFAWSAVVAFDYLFWFFKGEWFWLSAGTIPLALSFVGLRGTYGNRKLTWLATIGLALFIFAPGLLGVYFAPAALLMFLAAISDAFFIRRLPRSTQNGGAA